MRNLKKFLALVLATMMMLSVAVFSTSAADEADYNDAASFLAALNIMKGDENGNLNLGTGVTRYQAALFFVQALTGETDVAYWNSEKKSAHFADVPEYGTAIDHAYGINLIKGRGNGVYGYNDPIMYQDMLVMAVRALGYETADMAYPYGYILAAQKLGLTENVDQKNYKAALTRGETAQIIADMLETEIAEFDPLNDKLLYPGDEKTCLTVTLNPGAEIKRITLLEDVGFAGGKVNAIVGAFDEADENDEEDIDTVEIIVAEDVKDVANKGDKLVVAATDLGIDADTIVASYAGLPVELYINLAEKATFTQADYDDEDATIVLATYPEYTTVTNVTGEGDIKYVAANGSAKAYLSLGGEKFADDKFSGEVFTFDAKDAQWEKLSGADARALLANFAFVDGEYEGKAGSTYASVSYRVTDRKYDPTPADANNKDEKTIVEILYTPLSFGQYNVREIKDVKYPVIATYSKDAKKNMDEETTKFVETIVGSTKVVTFDTKTVSNKDGEKALALTLAGEAVEAGDFMFYAYNSVDNILTVAKNCGTFTTGRLTGKTTVKSDKAVKINGTAYTFGFDGVYALETAAFDFHKVDADYIQKLEAGKDNVKYLAIDGKIVYMEAISTSADEATFDFAIINQTDKLAELLEYDYATEKADFEKKLTTEGLYIEDGAVKVAMLNKTTGEWELVTVAKYATDWDATDAEFDNEYVIADEAKYADLVGKDYKNAKTVKDFAALKGLVAVVEEADGVYTIAKNTYTAPAGTTPADYGFFVGGQAADPFKGLAFADNNDYTNTITADDKVDAARVTLTDDTVIIVVDAAGNAGVRTGKQTSKNNFPVDAGYFLAASSELIVLVETDAAANTAVADWGKAAAANAKANYYITTLTSEVDVEAGETKEDDYIITITNVFDMKNFSMVESVTTELDKNSKEYTDVLAINGAGTKLYMDETGKITTTGKTFSAIATELALVENDEYVELKADAINKLVFTDGNTLKIDGHADVNGINAFDIAIKVVTIDNTNLDPEKYDFSAAVSNTEWKTGDESNKYGVGDVTVVYDNAATTDVVEEKTFWEYALDLETVKDIEEPTEGVLNQYIIDTDANTSFRILVPEVDNDNYADAAVVQVKIACGGTYLVEDGVVTMVIYKVLSK